MSLTVAEQRKAAEAARDIINDYAPGAPESVRLQAEELLRDVLDMGPESSLAQGDRGEPRRSRRRRWR